MRHPERWRNVALAGLAAGLVILFAAFALPSRAAEDSQRAALFMLGLTGLIFGGVGAIIFQLAAKARSKAKPIELAPVEPSPLQASAGGLDPESLRTCWKCGFQTHTVVALCERCGEPMLSRRGARTTGWLLSFIGVLLGVCGLVMLYIELPTLLHPGVEIDGSRFDGSPSMAMFVLSIFAGLAFFGFATLAYGIFQIATGRRSLFALRVMLGIVGVLYVLGWVLRKFFG